MKCPNGLCVNDLRKCEDKKERCRKDGLYYCALTQSCANSPTECIGDLSLDDVIQCNDGSVVNEIDECPRLLFCPPQKPVKCANGLCVREKTDCPEKPVCSNQTLCQDGICRDECLSEENFCHEGVLCPNMECKLEKSECAVCEADEAKYKCWNGKCVSTFEECERPPRIDPFEVTLTRAETEVAIFTEDGRVIEVSIPPFSLEDAMVIIESFDSIDLFTELENGGHVACSSFVSFSTENHVDVELDDPATLFFSLSCEEDEDVEKYLVSISSETGEMEIVGVLNRNEDGFYFAEVSHFSSYGVIIPGEDTIPEQQPDETQEEIDDTLTTSGDTLGDTGTGVIPPEDTQEDISQGETVSETSTGSNAAGVAIAVASGVVGGILLLAAIIVIIVVVVLIFVVIEKKKKKTVHPVVQREKDVEMGDMEKKEPLVAEDHESSGDAVEYQNHLAEKTPTGD